MNRSTLEKLRAEYLDKAHAIDLVLGMVDSHARNGLGAKLQAAKKLRAAAVVEEQPAKAPRRRGGARKHKRFAPDTKRARVIKLLTTRAATTAEIVKLVGGWSASESATLKKAGVIRIVERRGKEAVYEATPAGRAAVEA